MGRFMRRAGPVITMFCAIALLMLAPIIALQSYHVLTITAANLGYTSGYGLEAIIFLGSIWEAVILVALVKDMIRREL